MEHPPTPDHPATSSVGPSSDGGDAPRRTRALRSAAQIGCVPSLVVFVYSACTWSLPNRPAMVAMAGLLLLVSGAVWLAAADLTVSRLRQPVNLASVVVHLCGYATISALDGGVTSPMGIAVFLSLTMQAIRVPYRPLAFFAVVSVGAYWAVVALGDPAPPGYPWVYTAGFLVITAICARHAGAMASLRRRLAEVVRVDPLTGCLNRRGFDERLHQERSRADRTGVPLTLVLVDLDGFKAVNDTHGHQTGDHLLVWTARTLREVARADDVVARIGGDEFAVILTAAGPVDAAPVVERLRAALDLGSPASLGAASYPDETTDPDALRHLADQRVYDDKSRRAVRPVHPSAPLPTDLMTAGAPPCPTVPTSERRRQSIADIARLGTLNFGVGLVHTLFFRADTAPGSALVTVMALGVVLGVVMLATARPVTRSRHVGTVLTTQTICLFALAVAVTLFDGGMSSIYAIGTLTPLPIIALSTPKRTSIPFGVVVVVNAVAQGVLVGAPSAWYVILHLFGILSISVACAVHGATAARRRGRLTRLSRVDSLTDCLNRRGFEERFDAAVAAARRHGDPLALLVLDLDGFKQRNDTEGHAAGDELLRWVATALTDLVRDEDVVGRLGGDEFVVLVTGCPSEDVDVIAQRAGALVGVRCPASIGSATLDRDGADFDSLYRHADALLYADKARRRATPAASAPVPAPVPSATSSESRP